MKNIVGRIAKVKETNEVQRQVTTARKGKILTNTKDVVSKMIKGKGPKVIKG